MLHKIYKSYPTTTILDPYGRYIDYLSSEISYKNTVCHLPPKNPFISPFLTKIVKELFTTPL